MQPTYGAGPPRPTHRSAAAAVAGVNRSQPRRRPSSPNVMPMRTGSTLAADAQGATAEAFRIGRADADDALGDGQAAHGTGKSLWEPPVDSFGVGECTRRGHRCRCDTCGLRLARQPELGGEVDRARSMQRDELARNALDRVRSHDLRERHDRGWPRDRVVVLLNRAPELVRLDHRVEAVDLARCLALRPGNSGRQPRSAPGFDRRLDTRMPSRDGIQTSRLLKTVLQHSDVAAVLLDQAMGCPRDSRP